MHIKVLGTGCSKCNTLEKNVKAVLANAKIEATVEKVEDLVEIMKYAVMTTPALVVNDKLVATGRIPSDAELQKFFAQ